MLQLLLIHGQTAKKSTYYDSFMRKEIFILTISASFLVRKVRWSVFLSSIYSSLSTIPNSCHKKIYRVGLMLTTMLGNIQLPSSWTLCFKKTYTVVFWDVLFLFWCDFIHNNLFGSVIQGGTLSCPHPCCFWKRPASNSCSSASTSNYTSATPFIRWV